MRHLIAAWLMLLTAASAFGQALPTPTFQTLTVNAGGTLSGTFGGTPTFSGPLNTTNSAGYKLNGATVMNVVGTPGANTATILGSNAGALVTSSMPFVTFLGDSVGQHYVGGGGGEVLCAGSLSCAALTSGSHDVGLGIGALWWEKTGSLDTCVGSDACRNTVGVSGVSVFGQGAMHDGAGPNNVAVGLNALEGNAAALQISGTLATGDVLSGTLTLTGVTGSPFAWSYTVGATDTLSNIAGRICAASSAFSTINGGTVGSFSCGGLSNTGGGSTIAIVSLGWNGTGTTGDIITLTASTTGAEVLTATGGWINGSNTAVGYQALQGVAASTATNDVALGLDSMQYITTGSSNVCLGTQTCQFLTSGGQNLVAGFQAGLNFTTATQNVLLGYAAGTAATTASSLVVIGWNAGIAITSATSDVLIGRNVAKLVTNGPFNTCVGDQACLALTTGGSTTYNTAFGASSGASITSGAHNLTLGPQVAMTTLTTGSNNVVIGTTSSCDTPASGTTAMIVLCGSAGQVMGVTGTGTPSTSIASFAGALQVGSATNLTVGNGDLGMIKITASGSAPGASGGKIELVCGTTAGSAKLILYAGTSTTPVTLVDNAGTGVTGC